MAESFFQWFDVAVQKLMTGMFLDSIAWVDWLAFLFLFLGILYGVQNGFLAEIAEILQIMVVIFIVIHCYPYVELFMHNHLRQLPKDSRAAIAYVLTAATIWGLAALIFKYARNFFHTDLTKPLRLIGGGFLGGIHLIIIFSFLLQAVTLMPLSQPKKALQEGGSISGYYIASLAPAVHAMFANPIAIFQESST